MGYRHAKGPVMPQDSFFWVGCPLLASPPFSDSESTCCTLTKNVLVACLSREGGCGCMAEPPGFGLSCSSPPPKPPLAQRKQSLPPSPAPFLPLRPLSKNSRTWQHNLNLTGGKFRDNTRKSYFTEKEEWKLGASVQWK